MAKHQLIGQSCALGFSLDLLTQTGVPALSSTGFRLDAALEQGGMCGLVAWASRTGSKTIAGIHWTEGSAVAGTYSCRIGVQDMSTTAQGLPDGTFDHYKDVGSTTTGAVNTVFDTGSAKTVNYHDAIAVVWKMMTYSSGRVQPVGLVTRGTSDNPLFSGFVKTDTAGDWSVPSEAAILANVVIEFDDGSFGWIEGGTPGITAVNAEAFNVDTAGGGVLGASGDERALRFTVTPDLWLDGMRGMLTRAAATADFDVVLYNGTSARSSRTYDSTQAVTATAVRRDTFFFVDGTDGDQAVEAGNTYYAAFKPTTTSNITIYTASFAAAGHAKLLFGGILVPGYDCRAGAGAWENIAGSDLRVPLYGLSLSAFDDGAGGSGGNANILTGSVVK